MYTPFNQHLSEYLHVFYCYCLFVFVFMDTYLYIVEFYLHGCLFKWAFLSHEFQEKCNVYIYCPTVDYNYSKIYKFYPYQEKLLPVIVRRLIY